MRFFLKTYRHTGHIDFSSLFVVQKETKTYVSYVSMCLKK
jgi:hypothetical protein